MVCHACSGLLRADDGALCPACREALLAARATDSVPDKWRVWLAELRGVDVSRVACELVTLYGRPYIRLFLDGESQGYWNLNDE